MIIRNSEERGHNVISWLDSWHSFSFGHYYDPKWQGFNSLLVVNEDFIAPSMGFGMHPHRDMEILTFVISGELRHQDSMGNLGLIRPGEIQVMSAGTGIYHSEHNNRETDRTHLLQIWVLPDRQNHKPRYDQKTVFNPEEYNFLKVIAAPFSEPSDGVHLNAKAKFWLGRFDRPEEIHFKPTTFPHYWIQIVKGEMSVNGRPFKAGDALGFEATEESKLSIGDSGVEFLIIEVA